MRRLRGPGLAARLLAAQLLVLVTAVVTAWLIAAAVGPSIFHNHLGQVTHTDSAHAATTHAERAFHDASVISLGVALLAALTVAFVVSAFATRIAGPVQALAAAASDVAAGRYDVTMRAPGLGIEFDTLATSFTSMAARLHSVETTRRQLLADLAHEMRTPVAVLDGYLEGFEDGVVTLDPDTAAMLRAQTRRLARLSEDISAVSRAEEHQLQLHPVTVAPELLVSTAAGAHVDRYAEREVALTTAVEHGLPPVSVDVDRFGQVLGNLLDNALRHSAPGDTVQIKALRAGEDVTVQVADTGTGIPVEHLSHVFERFYRVDAARDREHGGSGIGLAIAKALVETHGGRITVASAGIGTGATFTIRLPAAASAPHS